MSQTTESVEEQLRAALVAALNPADLQIINESELHAGHRSSPGTGNSHFRISIVSAKFAGVSRIMRHRMVNQAVAPLIGNPIHALALETIAPDDRQASKQS